MSKRKLHTVLSATVVVIGIALMAGKIVFDSEPGLIPVLLVVAGIAWFSIARTRIPPRDE